MMKKSTETLLRFAELVETEPPILPGECLAEVQQLLEKLETISETEADEAANVIINWLQQFTEIKETFKKARKQHKKRTQLKEISDPTPNDVQWTIPNFEIIEEPEKKQDMVLITPAPEETQKISLLSYIRQSLSQWMQKNQ